MIRIINFFVGNFYKALKNFFDFEGKQRKSRNKDTFEEYLVKILEEFKTRKDFH